jgi:hypothetical protein
MIPCCKLPVHMAVTMSCQSGCLGEVLVEPDCGSAMEDDVHLRLQDSNKKYFDTLNNILYIYGTLFVNKIFPNSSIIAC